MIKISTKIYLLYLLFFFFFSNVESFATTYYASPTGSSSAAGTIGAPLTFAAAIGKSLVAGDSVILRGGMYSFSSSVTLSKSGNSSNFIHYLNYPGEIPVLDFRSQAYGNRGVSISGSYIHLKGITVQGAGDNGIYVSGNNNKIQNCTTRWNCDSGFQFKTGSNNLILNCDSYENFDYKTGGISSPDYGGNADGFADKQYTNTSGTNTYRGCRSWRNSDDGWDSYEKIGNTEYDSCWCYQMGPSSYDMSTNIRFKTDSASWFYLFKSTNFVITNYGNGNGFKLGGNYTANNATLKNCVSVENPTKGFDQNNDAGAMVLYNCTSYKNYTNYGFSNSSYGTLVIKNSISLSGTSSNSFKTTSYTQSNNTWSSGFSCSADDFVSIDVSQLLNDRQTDGALPEITLLHLISTSSLIDKGIDVGISYSGSAPDLGAFEYYASTPVSLVYYNNNIKIFPNPVNATSAIFYNSSSSDVITIQLIDMSGKVLQKYNAVITTGDNLIPLNSNELSKGSYLCNISGKTVNYTCRFIK